MLHDLRYLLPLVIISGGFALVGGVLYGAWLLGRYRGREEEMAGDLANVEARLQRVEQALAQTTGALDRLEAAHRVTARLLTDTPQQVPRLPGRHATPH